MNARNPASQKLAVASNIPNANPSSVDRRLESLGASRQAEGRFYEARRLYERWYRITKNTEAALRLGDVCRQTETFGKALQWYRRAEKSTEDPQLVADARLGQAMCVRGLEKYHDAILLLKKSLRQYRIAADKEGTAYALWALGTTQRFAGDVVSAEKNLRESLKIYRTLDDPSGLAYARCGLGGTLRMRGKYPESLALYAQAHRYFQSAGDRFGEAYSCCGQSNALRMKGALNRALPLMKRAEALYRRLKQKGPLGFVLWSRAQLEMERGSFAVAGRYLMQSRRLFKSVNDCRGMLYCDLGEAEILRLNNNPSFLLFFRRVAALARRLNLPLERGYAEARFKTQKRPCKIIKIP